MPETFLGGRFQLRGSGVGPEHLYFCQTPGCSCLTDASLSNKAPDQVSPSFCRGPAGLHLRHCLSSHLRRSKAGGSWEPDQSSKTVHTEKGPDLARSRCLLCVFLPVSVCPLMSLCLQVLPLLGVRPSLLLVGTPPILLIHHGSPLISAHL